MPLWSGAPKTYPTPGTVKGNWKMCFVLMYTFLLHNYTYINIHKISFQSGIWFLAWPNFSEIHWVGKIKWTATAFANKPYPCNLTRMILWYQGAFRQNFVPIAHISMELEAIMFKNCHFFINFALKIKFKKLTTLHTVKCTFQATKWYAICRLL